MRLRPYQAECLERIQVHLRQYKSTLVVMATGCGKTVLFSHTAAVWPSRVLVIAHRDELIRQAADKIQAVTHEEPGIEMGAEYSSEHGFTGIAKPKVVVSSVQTMCRPNRQKRFDPTEFGLLIIDEAHHATSTSYRSVIDYFARNPDLRVLGVTATPKRADGLAMGQVFESVCYDYGIESAIEDGWLVPVKQQAITVEGLDFSRVKSIAGDLSKDELEEILAKETMLHAVAAPTVEIAGIRPALVFCVTVKHAELLAEVIQRYSSGRAVALSGETDQQQRRDTIAAYKSGQIQYLCNCALFLEGFDAPTTSLVVMARPTKSLSLYTQVVGRGTRPLPGIVDGLEMPTERRSAIAGSGKPDMLILDFVGNSGRHQIITAEDLLGGKYTEPEKRYSRKLNEGQGGAIGVEESLQRAKEELALLDEMKRRQHVIASRAEYEARSVNPFGKSGHTFSQDVAPKEPATEKQVWYLVNRLGWDQSKAAAMSKVAAGAIIGKSRAVAS